jgi:hypothetical protein
MIQEVVEAIENTVKDVMNSNLHTNMPAEIVALNLEEGTVDLKPVGSYYVNGMEMEYPVVPSVPLVLNASGAGQMSFVSPIKEGDTVMMACAEQSLSTWRTGTSKEQMDERFELQNAMAIPGLQKEAVEAQIEANEEEAYILTNGDAKCLVGADRIEIQCGGAVISIEGGEISVEGNLNVSGDLGVSGNLSMNGNLDVGGDITCGGDFPCKGGTNE